MKNFLRLTCSKCLRTVDRAINNSHYTPDKCTITFGCEGRLSPLMTLSNPTISVTPETGVKDWHPRQLKVTSVPEPISTSRTPTVNAANVIGINDGLINVETGTLKQIILAVKASTTGRTTGLPDVCRVVFDIASDRPRDYKHFIFRTETEIVEIGASDPGLNPRPLRYNVAGTSPDVVEVRVNGVLRPRSSTLPDGYVLYDSPTSKVAPNSILFNSPLPVLGRTQVDITVSKSAGATQQQVAPFKKQVGLDESRKSAGAFENVGQVEKFNATAGVWELFDLYCMDLDTSGLRLNTLMTPAPVQIESSVDFKSAFFLIARQPYTQVDRYSSMTVPLTNFSLDEKKFIKYYEDTQLKRTTIRVSVESLETVYPLLRFKTWQVERPIKTPVPGMTEQVTIDGNIIVGPDT